ncbi:hypothetical protein FRC07_011340, partial [Ceratobasidium sp. 392]
MASHDADIWLPQVEPNKQIVYVRVNRLGHRRMDLPAAGDLDNITTRNLLLPCLNPLFAPPPPPIARQRANTAMTASSLGGFAFVAHSTTARPQASHQQRSGVSLQKPLDEQ